MLKWTLLMVVILLLVYEPQECEGKFGALKGKILIYFRLIILLWTVNCLK